MRGALLFPPTLHAFFAKHSKTRKKKAENGSIFGHVTCVFGETFQNKKKKKAENGSIFGREKNKTPNFQM